MARELGEERWGGWTGFYKTADVLFTPAVMGRGFDLLEMAKVAASGDAQVARRVAFLEEGLKHAELTMAVHAEYRRYTNDGESEGYVQALKALESFRVETEGDNIANMAFLTWAENRTWDRSVLKDE